MHVHLRAHDIFRIQHKIPRITSGEVIKEEKMIREAIESTVGSKGKTGKNKGGRKPREGLPETWEL